MRKIGASHSKESLCALDRFKNSVPCNVKMTTTCECVRSLLESSFWIAPDQKVIENDWVRSEILLPFKE